MGLFDRFSGKPRPQASEAPGTPPAASKGGEAPRPESGAGSPPLQAHAAGADAPAGAVVPRLAAAREKLDMKDLQGALAAYEEILSDAGDRADVLVRISGDLGATGHATSIIELIAPRYDAERHGPATGFNLLQAYLAARDPEAAQHVLDLLFELGRPELEDRLHGFSNAIAELMALGTVAGLPEVAPLPQAGAPAAAANVSLISIGKPIWFYGLEPMMDNLLPDAGRLRRIAFAQLALPGAHADIGAAMAAPEDEAGRLSRAIPLWLADTFFFSSAYAPIAAIGSAGLADGPRSLALFPTEWTVENLRQLVETSAGGLDYIVTGSLREKGDSREMILRIWEVRKYRERKQFTATWTAETADAELGKLHAQLTQFMEWTPFPEGAGLPYAPHPSPKAWADALGVSLSLFLLDKGLVQRESLAPVGPAFDAFAPHAFSPPSASLAWLTLCARAKALGIAPPLADVMLNPHPAVAKARSLLGL